MTFYAVTRDGKLKLDLPGLLSSGKMDKQFRALRQLRRAYQRQNRK